MSLQELSTEDLVKEIQRRKSAEVGELRRQIDEHKKAIKELEDRIRNRDGEATPVRRVAAAVGSLRICSTLNPASWPACNVAVRSVSLK